MPKFQHILMEYFYRTRSFLNISASPWIVRLHTRNTLVHYHQNLKHVPLDGTGWGSTANVLRTSTLASVYAAAEYGSSVWINSTYTRMVDIELNDALRIITGTLKYTPLPRLPLHWQT